MKKVKGNISLVDFLCASVFMLMIFTSTNLFAQETVKKEIEKYTQNLQFDFPELSIPQFPDKKYNVIDYGAVGDGSTKNTLSINKAIAECSANGGGHVLIPPGVWITGSIELQSNVDLHLQKGALVVFSADHKDFPLIKTGGNSYDVMNPLYGIDLENIAITGEGIFDGNGQTWRPVKKSKMTSQQWKDLLASGGVVSEKGDMWWPNSEAMNAEKYLSQKKKSELTKEDFENVRDFLRPYMFYLNKCKNIFLEDFTLQNSPKFAMNLRGCENIIVRKVKVMNEWWTQNGDGLDFSACKNVLIYGCTVNAGDDAICMKSSGNPDKGPKMENIVIADCVVYAGHGGFVIGSNTDGGIKNISVRNCSFIGTDTGLRFKSGIGRGGLVENIFIENVFMKDIKDEAIIFDMFYSDAAAVKMMDDKIENHKIPNFQNIYISNVICDGAAQAILVKGLDNEPVKNIRIKDSFIKSKKGAELNEADGFVFENFKILSDKTPVYNLINSRNFKIMNPFIKSPDEIVLKASGIKTKQIIFEGVKGSMTDKNLEISPEIQHLEIIIN